MPFLAFIIGLVLGSFLSVVFTRLEIDGEGISLPHKNRKRKRKRVKPGGSLKGQSIIFGRSRCDHCGRTVAWYDNVPLLSYLLLRGTCRHCGQPIDQYHPVLELASGLLLVAISVYYGLTPQGIVAAVFGLFMLLIFAYDLRYQIIPNVVVVPAILLALVTILYQYVLVSNHATWQLTLWSTDPESYLLAAGVLGLFFLALSAISRGSWIGGGDLKLAVLLGLVLGWPAALVAAMAAYLIGTLYAVVLLVTRRATLKTSVAFGPMLVIGYFIAAFYGDVIVNWYQGLVLL